MVDFNKRLKNKAVEKKINPIEIYNSLDRRSEAGPLRPSQVSLLDQWYREKKNEVDNIVKLHTGEGKTLIGLLMLQSKLNENEEPCLYLCPNIYLANQVKYEARKFGIPICELSENNDIPDEFMAGKSILISHVQKLFNGKTIFRLNNKSVKANSVLLDDSHACIDSIRDALTIKLPKGSAPYQKLRALFEEDLSAQGPGSYLEISNGNFNTMLPIPYWSWHEKNDEVVRVIQEYSDDIEIKFAWDVIKDKIADCQAFISGEALEISPLLVPIDTFGTFAKAKHRILMSATTQDDAFAIKGLGISINAIKNPLSNNALKWSGEKMILIPSLIDESLDRDAIIKWLMANDKDRKYGVVSLTPDFKKNQQYEDVGAVVADRKTIFPLVQKLKGGDFSKTVVFANRYDGIDLPDDACRILIFDSKPYFDSLVDRYEEECRSESDIFNTKIAQKVEQGLGRSVRGEKDYSVIVILGGDLVKFIKSRDTMNHFSAQTRKQIAIGMQVAEFAKEELTDKAKSFSVLSGLISKSLQRDDGWKSFYVEEMDTVDVAPPPIKLYDSLKMEYDAEVHFTKGNLEKACELMQKLADQFSNQPLERGWYLQSLARYRYRISKIESNETQKSAFLLNYQLLKPKTGIVYKKIEAINENRIVTIKKSLAKFGSYAELSLSVDSMLDNLSFGVSSEKFEQALQELGEMLGFFSQRPDKLIRKGPDNLWGGADNQYYLFECKNEVDENRVDISKDEAGQMNSHCGWFEEVYNVANCKRILIIPTKKLSYHANFTHDVKIMRKANLKKLKKNVKAFVTEFAAYQVNELSDAKIQLALVAHGLDIQSLLNEYSEDYIKQK